MQKKGKIIVSILTLIFIVSFGGTFLTANLGLKEISPPLLENQETQSINLDDKDSEITKTILEINGKRYEGEVAEATSVYDFMKKLQNEGQINFTEKSYTGIGKFIVTINGVKGNGEQNWIFYVNDKKAQVGVSNYELNPGDVVSWKYEKNY